MNTATLFSNAESISDKLSKEERKEVFDDFMKITKIYYSEYYQTCDINIIVFNDNSFYLTVKSSVDNNAYGYSGEATDLFTFDRSVPYGEIINSFIREKLSSDLKRKEGIE